MIRKWIVEKFKSPGFHDRISLSSWDAREGYTMANQIKRLNIADEKFSKKKVAWLFHGKDGKYFTGTYDR